MIETRQLNLADLLKRTIYASVQTDVGCIREVNEDSVRHISPNDAETLVRKGTLTIVADGMGGHASGEVASGMAVELISEIYYASEETDAAYALQKAIKEANWKIYETSLTNEKFLGMGTTLAALLLFDNFAITAHVGDSRVYRLHDSQMEMLTIDHSQVMEMVKHGILSMEEARNHDDKNVILRAVGTQAAVDVEVSRPFGFEVGDAFLLCSDGLSDMVSNEEIQRIWTAADDIYTAVEQLIDEAKRQGGHDNITVGIIKIAETIGTEVKRTLRITREIEV